MGLINPTRGEIWKVSFDKTVGQEIRKTRGSVVMNVPKAGRKQMRILVPITSGHENFNNLAWMVRINKDSANGLDHDSFADASQVQPASIKRFIEKMGVVQSNDLLNRIAAAIALSVGYNPTGRKRRRK